MSSWEIENSCTSDNLCEGRQRKCLINAWEGVFHGLFTTVHLPLPASNRPIFAWTDRQQTDRTDHFLTLLHTHWVLLNHLIGMAH